MTSSDWTEIVIIGWIGASWLYVGYGAKSPRHLVYRWIGAMAGVILAVYTISSFTASTHIERECILGNPATTESQPPAEAPADRTR